MRYHDLGHRDPCKCPGTFTCGGCNYCRFVNTTRNVTLPNGERYRPKHYANCQTTNVVYLLLCDCFRFYVGKTIQPFWRRAYQHILSMQTSNPSLPLGRHVRDLHEGITPKISFLILDRMHPGSRGGDINKLLMNKG